MITIMANGQMGTFNLQKDGTFISNSFLVPSSGSGFLSYRKPIFGLSLSTKTANRVWILGVRTTDRGIANAVSKKGVENRLIGGRLLENEFKFEPSFNEYLKVMETVSVGRDNNPTQDVNRYHLEKKHLGEDFVGTLASAGRGEDANLGCSNSNLRQVENASSLERGKGRKNAKIRYSDGNALQRNELSDNGRGGRHQVWNSSGKDFGRVKLVRESEADLKNDQILGLCEKYNDMKERRNCGDLEKRNMHYDARYSKVQKGLQKNGGWVDQVTCEEKETGESRISKTLKDVRGTGVYENFDRKGSGYSRREESHSFDHSTVVQKEQLQQNKTWAKGKVDNVEKKMDELITIKGMPGKGKLFRINFTSKMGEYETEKSTLEGESYRKMNTGRKTPKSETNGSTLESGRVFRNYVEEKIHQHESELYKHKTECEESHGRLDVRNSGSICTDKRGMAYKSEIGGGEQSTYADEIGKDFRDRYKSQNHVRLHEDSVEVEKMGSGETEILEDLSKNFIREGKGGRFKILQEDGKVERPRLLSMEDEDENDLTMERKAFKSFEVFTDVRGRPRVLRMEMEERIQKLAKWLNGTDIDMPEWQFSKIMHSAKIRFSDHTILRLVQILGALGNWRRVLQVVQWLQSRERFNSYKSRYIYTTVINVLGKAKRPVEALNVFYAMLKDFSSYPDLAAYHSIAVTLGRAGHMEELFDVIDCMRALPEKKFKTGMIEKWDPRLEPDAVVYNAVLNACVVRKQWEGAFWVLQQLKKQWIQPSNTTYGLVMEVMFACGKYSLVHEFFRKVEKTSIPNYLSYKVLINTLWKEGKTDEAVLVVQDMERRGIVGSASLYYDLARCLCSAGRCEEALQQIDKICKVAKKPLVVTYTGLIQACLDSGSVQNGAYMFSQMHKFCSPNLVTCNIMLKAYTENKMFEDAKDLFQKILDGTTSISNERDYRNRVIPDSFMFNTMLEACVEEQRWDDFQNFYKRMLHHGFHFNPKRHLRMILEASRAGKGQSLNTTWHYLTRLGWTVPVAIIKERFCMNLQEDNIDTALSCFVTDQMTWPRAFSEKAWLDLLNANANRIRKDTLVRLVDEVDTLISKSDHPNSVYQNLASSCKEFFRVHDTATATSSSVNRRTLSVVAS